MEAVSLRLALVTKLTFSSVISKSEMLKSEILGKYFKKGAEAFNGQNEESILLKDARSRGMNPLLFDLPRARNQNSTIIPIPGIIVPATFSIALGI